MNTRHLSAYVGLLSLFTATISFAGAPPAKQAASPGQVGFTPPPTTMDSEAFDSGEHAALPLTPAETRKYRESLQDYQRARHEPIAPPKPVFRSISVNLDPSSPPDTLNLAIGYDTPLVIVDDTGQPWPMLTYSVGDPSAFSAALNGNSALTLSATKPFAQSNLVITLKGVATPIVFTLSAAGGVLDYRVVAQVSESGPNAKTFSGGGLALSDGSGGLLSDAAMTSFLDDTPPLQARRVDVHGGGATSAWVYHSQLVVRTRGVLVSPGHTQLKRGVNNYSVYVVPQLSPILGIDNDGETDLVSLAIGSDLIVQSPYADAAARPDKYSYPAEGATPLPAGKPENTP